MAIHTIVTLLLTILITFSPPVGGLAPQVNYVHPLNGSISCKSEPCTFDQYAHDPERYFLPNTTVTFSFLPGDHQLSNSLHLQNVSNVAFQGMSMETGSVTVRLGPQVGLSFANCDSIEIKSLDLLLSGDFEYRLMFSNTTNVQLHNIVLSTEDESNKGCSAVVSQASVIDISNSSFVGISGQFGAALLALDSSEITFMGTNNFISNSAKLGGAIHSISSTLQFNEMASFIDNSAFSNEKINDTLCYKYTSYYSNEIGNGGAIYANSSHIVMRDCAQFVTNKATNLGGAVAAMNDSMLVIDGSSCLVTESSPMGMEFDRNCVATDNVMLYYINKSGGAIYSHNSTVNITNISFLNNIAPVDGGAAYFLQSNVTVYNITAVNNTANSSFGGAIRFYSCIQVYIGGDNHFVNNHAASYGGALEFCNVQSLEIAGVNYFEGNTAENGGAFDILNFYSAAVLISGDIMFKNNTAKSGGDGGALYLSGPTVNCTGNMEYKNNTAGYGGALYLSDSIVNCTGNMEYKNNTAGYGGALYLSGSTVNCTGNMEYKNNTAGCGGAIYLIYSSTLIINCTGNKEYNTNTSSAVYISHDRNYGDCKFINNMARESGGAISSYFNSRIIFHGDTVFRNNYAESYGGAIFSENSKIIYNGHSYNTANIRGESISSTDNGFLFDSNTADYGGAIAVFGTTKVILDPHTKIVFTENQAQYFGGAIYASIYTSSACSTMIANIRPECFIMFNTCHYSLNSSHILLNFTNNNAGMHGNILYGGWLNKCNSDQLFLDNSECNNQNNQRKDSAFEIVKKFSSIIQENGSSTNFSSKPSILCINYNESLNTTNHCGLPVPRKVSPGQTFTVAMLTLDQYNNIVDGEVMSNQSNTDDMRIKYDSDTIKTNLLLKNFTFQVLVGNKDYNNTQLNFSLFLEGPCKNRTHFDITLLPCPFGFEFSTENRKCHCANVLQRFTEDCYIENITIGRPSNTFWISYEADYILFREEGCPLDYCNDTKVYVPQNNSDIQCSSGRTGTLCGKCMETNYSLALGSLTCIQDCTDVYLSLILPIGALGILLIMLLFMLRLTVAAGTINGLIFYANIVQANHQTFLPTKTTHQLITVFIGWLNLDFGIETCFYDGMDILAYSWLQFLFPVYLWILMLIIILSARYSRRVAKSLGQNPVAVLATVLLISYGKMLKAIIVPLSYAKLKIVTEANPDITKDEDTVWLYNGDISYTDRDHMNLVIFAYVVLLLLFLPYTFLLLCGHWLQAKSQWRILSWINKLKPFMDAYYAPFKKGKSYWLGLFLLARCSLFLNVAFVPDYAINLTVLSSVVAGLAIIKGRVYEKWHNDFLESSFLLNLCVLSITTLYVQSEKSDPNEVMRLQNILSSISVGIAVLYFIGIMVLHAYQRIRELKLLQEFSICKSYSIKKSDENAYNEQSLEIISNSSVSLREPLLDDDS